mmetsp:Transcript_95291/g.199310  ORF Transcript_95291/g.199310 Transcript_95291/m.199310 type:complete len:113 (-) Transcript_95291:6-344(-)
MARKGVSTTAATHCDSTGTSSSVTAGSARLPARTIRDAMRCEALRLAAQAQVRLCWQERCHGVARAKKSGTLWSCAPEAPSAGWMFLACSNASDTSGHSACGTSTSLCQATA